jgi:V8-like Glu-specific endopeptidase
MKSLMVILTVFAALATFAGTTNDIEKIIGVNDLVSVNADGTNIPVSYQKYINAYGIISMGCTATHIGNGYVITAGHCFEAPEQMVKDQPCNGITVKWGVREGAPGYLVSKCERIIAERLSDEADFAIFKVSPAPEVSVGVEMNYKAYAGNRVTIFSHPNMLPLRWSKYCYLQGAKFPGLPEQSIQHKCDTNPGSSGATIVDVYSKKIVGIHDGGILTSPGVGMNYGTNLGHPEIRDTLKELGF